MHTYELRSTPHDFPLAAWIKSQIWWQINFNRGADMSPLRETVPTVAGATKTSRNWRENPIKPTGGAETFKETGRRAAGSCLLMTKTLRNRSGNLLSPKPRIKWTRALAATYGHNTVEVGGTGAQTSVCTSVWKGRWTWNQLRSPHFITE